MTKINSVKHTLIVGRDSIVSFLCTRGIRPNLLTLLGFAFSSASAVGFATGKFELAGVLLLVAGSFDMLDGQVAREGGTATRFGAFLDSVVDRYSDTVVFLGIMFNYLKGGRLIYAFVVAVALVGAQVTSYSRARGSPMIKLEQAGYLKRPERIALLIIGSLTRKIDVVVWILAVLTHLTVLQRILFIWRGVSESPAISILEAGEYPINGPKPPDTGKGAVKAPRFDILHWNYPRRSWQYYLVSGIVLVVVFMPYLWKFIG